MKVSSTYLMLAFATLSYTVFPSISASAVCSDYDNAREACEEHGCAFYPYTAQCVGTASICWETRDEAQCVTHHECSWSVPPAGLGSCVEPFSFPKLKK